MTRRLFQRLPIRHKLVAMIMLTSGIALVLASAGYLLNDFVRGRKDLERELGMQASLIAKNTTAALYYLDPDSAREILQTLERNPHVRSACLYNAEQALFAEFLPKSDVRPCPSAAPPDGPVFSRNRLELVIPVQMEDHRAGSLLVRSDLEVLQARLRAQILLVALLLVFTLGVAWLLSSWLQAIVSQPIVALADTAAEVSLRGDYGLRVQRTTADELGVLVDTFNRMLERIQLREAELSKTNEDLLREIGERKRAEQERAELLVREREANRLKDEFLATLSHELRTPLNAILGWTRLLRTSAVPPNGIDRALEKVERNAQVQSRLVEDLLEISRIVSGKLHLEMRDVDLVAIVNTAVDSIRPTAEARGVTIARQFAQPAMATVGDPDRLQQVVWNLLSNAVKFTPAGGTVTITLTRDAVLDELKVSDTGIGIDREFLPRVFDTFRQADASSTRAHGGLGLGLSIVRHLVEMHGGAVEAESEGPDTGATFTVRLPIRSMEPRPREPSVLTGLTGVDPGTLRGASVLVVDDDADTRELVVTVLETAGARVFSAESAVDGLTRGVDVAPDALVCDIAMPGQDGYSLLRQLVEALGPRAPRVTIALTAFAGERDREKALAAGFHRHVAKPFDPIALVHLLEELLAQAPVPPTGVSS